VPGAARVNDITLCWEEVEDEEGNKHCEPLTNAITQGSPNVLINGSPAARLGDATSHPCSIITGSLTVLINGQPAARIGDLLSCQCEENRGNIATGSTNVLIG